MNSGAIHETVVRDVVDVLTDMKDHDEVQFLLNKKNNKSFKSAATATKDMILTFPVICSSDISIENASMIAKAVERKAVAMMQMLFSAISISSSDNAIDYLKKVHTNINFGNDDITISGIADTIDRVAAELEAMNLAEIDHEVFDEVTTWLRNSNCYLPNSVNESSINNYVVTPTHGIMSVNEADDNNIIANTMSIARNGISATRDVSSIVKNMSDAEKNTIEIFNKQILASDIKKANELMPTLMIVTFNQKIDGINDVVRSNVVIGIKAKLYPVASEDIINRVRMKTQDNNGLNKFIRATTNEISFVKDFLFAIDKAKLDAMSYSKRNGSSKLWKVLERRSKKSKIRQILKMSNDASAISTLLVSQELVEYLKKNDNIDLEKVSVANNIMSSYNFMSIAICDDTMEVAKFIYDTGDDMYETLSFSHLEREASDGAYKKVINLMTKMQR